MLQDLLSKKIYFLLIFFFNSFISLAQNDLDYYLPDGQRYNSRIPVPKEVIGHEVGEWHVSHDRLVNYMATLANASERITIEQFGETYEKRPLVLLTITSPENHKNIEEIKRQHHLLTRPDRSANLDLNEMPAVLYMGFSIHGNEPSGSNASLAVAYHLAAATGEEIDKTLDNTVILLDPSFNPDGLNRFASWVNSRRSLTEVADPQNIEQNEVWPGGRTNHYWFDLNRDWLPAQHPESQARLEKFHEWKPNVLTDHHEMGTNSTYFFQPGIPSRNNPLTPARNFELTERMGEYHARALDKIGSFYFTKENYDDFYYGKGSTYPDIQGAVGILFEQASSRSHAQESNNGILRFPFTIRNQFTTALSTIQAVTDMRLDLLNHQRDFYVNSKREGARNRGKAYIFGSTHDPVRAYHLAELINRHNIDIYSLNKPVTAGGNNFSPTGSYIVPFDQPQYKLIEAMFETRTQFTDSLFYDISTWTLPLAFNLPYATAGREFTDDLIGEKFTAVQPEGTFTGTGNAYAYFIEWQHYYSPKVLYQLQSEGIRSRVATEPFENGGKKFGRGTIMIPAEGSLSEGRKLEDLLRKLAHENGVNITAAAGGLDYGSYSLGSPTFRPLKKPEIAILIGDGIRSYEAGEVWHLLDYRFKIPVTQLSVDKMNSYDLSRYNTIIMVSGSYSSISDRGTENLKTWISQGGTIIAQRTALSWLSRQNLGNLQFKKSPEEDSLHQRPYKYIRSYQGAQHTGGAIFKVLGDLTHPLLYGFSEAEIPVFRNHNQFVEPAKNPFGNPITYTSSPLLSGYISSPNLEQLKNTSAAGVANYGRGSIISFTDDHNFRAFWYGTNKLFLNALFFGPVIERGAGR